MFSIVDPPWNKIKSLKNTYDRVIWRSRTLLLISSITSIFQGFIIKSSYFSLYTQNLRVVYFMKWLLPHKSLEIRLSFYRPFSVCISYIEYFFIHLFYMCTCNFYKFNLLIWMTKLPGFHIMVTSTLNGLTARLFASESKWVTWKYVS